MSGATPSGLQPQSHAFIRDVIEQVRSGKKNKAEAFAQLKGMLQTGGGGGDDSRVVDIPDAASSGTDEGRSLSQEGRMNLINKIVDEKRSKGFLEEESTIQSSDDGKIREAWAPLEYTQTTPEAAASFQRRENPSMDARTHRIAQAESAIRADMFKECTFRPKIRALPASYNSANKDSESTPFYQRVTKWQRERDTEAKRRKDFVKESEVIDCTFHPRINKNSDRAVRLIRGEDKESAADRLYKSNETSTYARSKFIEDELRKEKLEEEQSCTFKPTLHTAKKKFAFVKTKFDQPLNRNAVDVETYEDSALKECTFTPKVKGIRANMTSAKMYVNTNVIDRLTRPVTAPQPSDEEMRTFDASDRPVMDVASFMGSMAPNFATPGRGNAGAGSRPASAPRERTQLSPEAKAHKKQMFQQFLTRQAQTKSKRDSKTREVEQAIQPKFTPQLCRKSIEMVENGFNGEFLNRVKIDISRRSESEKQRTTWTEPESTFKPKINDRSAKMSSRSAAEMSRGDQLRKNHNYRMMKTKTEQELMSEHTFKPIISKRAQSAGRGRLHLAADPTAVVAEYSKKKEDYERRKAEADERKCQEELSLCTFKPATKECPAYVKRIAQSMAIVRDARRDGMSDSTSPPQWRSGLTQVGPKAQVSDRCNF